MRDFESGDLQKVLIRMPVSMHCALKDLRDRLSAKIPNRPGRRRSVSLNGLCILAVERILDDPPSPREIERGLMSS